MKKIIEKLIFFRAHNNQGQKEDLGFFKPPIIIVLVYLVAYANILKWNFERTVHLIDNINRENEQADVWIGIL